MIHSCDMLLLIIIFDTDSGATLPLILYLRGAFLLQ